MSVGAFTSDEVLAGLPSLRARARQALAAGLVATAPSARLDPRTGYVDHLEDNLILTADDWEAIRPDFAGGAGNELVRKMKAPWSSSALVANAFGPWRRSPERLLLAGLNSFRAPVRFEVGCSNGVSAIPPHLDVVIEAADGRLVAVESKCTEFLTAKTAKVAAAYRALVNKADPRTRSTWYAALDDVPRFRLLDAYQLVKHFLGLRRTFPEHIVVLAYLFWEPPNHEREPLLAAHRAEIARFAALVTGDQAVCFWAGSYPELWAEQSAACDRPEWTEAHVRDLRRRYATPLPE